MTRSNPRRERGHTLVEVAMASGIFMVGVLGLVPLFYRGTQGTMVATRVTQATALAESRLAMLQHLPYTSAQLAAGTYNDGTKNVRPDGTADVVDFGTHSSTFWRTYSVTDVDYNPSVAGNDYKRIVVTVSWWDGSAKQVRSVTVATGKAFSP
jgi:Tfp pilus assembly protein PilV